MRSPVQYCSRHYGIGGDLPIIRPLVLTMAWGLVFSTIVTLGFIPILFSYVRVRKGSAGASGEAGIPA